MKRFLKVTGFIFIPLLVLGFTLKFYEEYLNRELFFYTKGEIKSDFSNVSIDKGTYLLKTALEKDNLLLMGSSELCVDVEQNPKNMMPNKDFNFNCTLTGRAYVQSLLSAIKLASLENKACGKKIALIVSMQWFMGEEINISGFCANFSELQFLKFLNNEKLSNDTKNKILKRTRVLLKNDPNFSFLALSSNLSALNFLREKFLEIKDKHISLKISKNFKDKKSETKAVNWEEEDKKATEAEMKDSTNNDYYVYDEYYEKYLKTWLEDLKDGYKEINLTKSKEVGDFEIFLKTCEELEIKPYLIFMPTNGKYYDYTGLDKKKREALYNKLQELSKNYGFNYLDLRDKEYEPYFLRDVMHLGRKGWIYVDKKIVKHFSKN